jgi:hypothetical protein
MLRLNQMTTLEAVVLGAMTLPKNTAIFVRPDSPWTAQTPCAPVDLDDCSDDGEPPSNLQHSGLVYALTLPTVWEIIENARIQSPTASVETLIKSIEYYIDNDAFMDLV